MKRIFWSLLASGAVALIGCGGCGGDVVIAPGTAGAGGDSSSSTTAEAGGSGTGGGFKCFPCARIFDDSDFEPSKLCPDSIAIHAALTACVCEANCPTECADYFCKGAHLGGACDNCADPACPAEMAACRNDYYPPK